MSEAELLFPGQQLSLWLIAFRLSLDTLLCIRELLRCLLRLTRWTTSGFVNFAVQQLEQLYDEMGPQLLAYFRRQRGLADMAEDLLQDTFLCALRRIDRLRSSVSPRAYLFGIARHRCVDALRRLRPVADEAVEELAEVPPDGDVRLEQMRTAIAELPEVHRGTLHLKLQHELSYEEIAEVLGVPIGTVRSRLHQSVRRLKQALNPNIPEQSSIYTNET